MNKKQIIMSVVVVMLLTAGVALADNIFNIRDSIVNTGNQESVIQEPQFGAFPGPDVYNKMYFHDGFLSDTTISESMGWATTSEGGAQIVNVKVRNDNLDLFCDPQSLLLDISTGVTSFGGFYQVGTTTRAGDVSLTNTTTATLIATQAIVTSTADILNISLDGGTFFEDNVDPYASSTPFIWAEGEYLVVSMAGEGGATSSDSFIAKGAFAGVGQLHVNCWYRYQE